MTTCDICFRFKSDQIRLADHQTDDSYLEQLLSLVEPEPAYVTKWKRIHPDRHSVLTERKQVHSIPDFEADR